MPLTEIVTILTVVTTGPVIVTVLAAQEVLNPLVEVDCRILVVEIVQPVEEEDVGRVDVVSMTKYGVVVAGPLVVLEESPMLMLVAVDVAVVVYVRLVVVLVARQVASKSRKLTCWSWLHDDISCPENVNP